MLILFAKIMDLLIDGSMKIFGIYLFFIKRDYFNGSFVFGMSGLYSLSMAARFCVLRSQK